MKYLGSRGLDQLGPKIVGHTPEHQAPAEEFIEVTFNDEIDASSFTSSDVWVDAPFGSIGLAGDPVESDDHRTFTIAFASALTREAGYTIKIGPDVRDLAGNLMNQNDGEGAVDVLFGDDEKVNGPDIVGSVLGGADRDWLFVNANSNDFPDADIDELVTDLGFVPMP